MPDELAIEDDFAERRSHAFRASVYREDRLGELRTVFDGWGVALIDGKPAPETTVVISNPDYELVADALERELPRCSFNNQLGLVTQRADGNVELSSYDWTKEAVGKVMVPYTQVQPLIELLRSVPGGYSFGFHDDRDQHYRLEVVHRGMPDHRGQPWQSDRPLLELFRRWHSSEGRHARRFLTTLDYDALLSRGEGEPLQLTTSEGEVIIDGQRMDSVVMPRIRSALGGSAPPPHSG